MSTVAASPVALISGGSSGIGLAVARLLHQRGFRVHLLARDQARLAEARAALEPAGGGRVFCHQLDVTDAAACAVTLTTILEQEGQIDWLVTSAGMAEPGMFLDQAPDAHRRHMEVNYFGTLNLVAPVARAMAARGAGRIVLVSSAVAFGAVAGYSAYAPGKFALHALGETLAMELAPLGVRVSVVFPPDTDTPQLAAERRMRPAITRTIAEGGGILSARTVALAIVEGALRGDVVIVPGRLMRLYGLFASLLAPVSRWRQIRLLRSGRGGP